MTDAPKMVKAKVSPHRSLYVDGKHHNGGSDVEVEEGEYKSLLADGFLVNPKSPEQKVSMGPKITRTT